jgi:hypothetical protein
MRYQLIVLILSCLTLGSCDHGIRENKVPSVVKNTFKARHPLSTDVEWEKDGTTYEAEFDWKGREISVKIEEAGKYLMEKQELPQQELPPVIVNLVKGNYKDYVIEETEKLVTGNVTCYQVELDARGKEEIKLVLHADGAPAVGINYWD